MRRLCFEETVEKVLFMLYGKHDKTFILDTCTGIIGFELFPKKIDTIDLIPIVSEWEYVYLDKTYKFSNVTVGSVKGMMNYYVGLYSCKNPSIMRLQVINAISMCISGYALGSYSYNRRMTDMITYAYLSSQKSNENSSSRLLSMECDFMKEFTNIFSTKTTRNNISIYIENVDYTNENIADEINRYIIKYTNIHKIKIPDELFNNLYSRILFIGLFHKKYIDAYKVKEFFRNLKPTSPKNRIDLIKKIFD